MNTLSRTPAEGACFEKGDDLEVGVFFPVEHPARKVDGVI